MRTTLLALLVIAAPLAARPKTFDEKTDYTKFSLDELIAALDAGPRNMNYDALAEILRRGPDALKAALPIVRDWQYCDFNETRMLAVLLVNRDQLEHPPGLVAEFRTAADPETVFLAMAPPGLRDTRPLIKATDSYLAPPLLKALRSDTAEDRAAAIAILGEGWFVGTPSLVAEVVKLAASSTGERRKEYLDLLAKAGAPAMPVYARYLSGDDTELRAVALKALTGAKLARDPAAAALLRPLFAHKDERVRRTVLQAAFLMGDSGEALAELLKLDWPNPAGAKDDGPAGPAFPKEVDQHIRFMIPREVDQALPVLKEAILADTHPRATNAAFVMDALDERALPLWRELTECKIERVRAGAKRMVESLAAKEKFPFEKLPAAEQKAEFLKWLEGPFDERYGRQLPEAVPQPIFLDALPLIEEKINATKGTDDGRRHDLVQLLLKRGGDKGEAVLARLLEAGDPAIIKDVLDVPELEHLVAHPKLEPGVRKNLDSKSTEVRLLAALVLSRSAMPGDAVVKILKEMQALTATPVKLAEALGRNPKNADEIAANVREFVCVALVRADAAGRKQHLSELLKLFQVQKDGNVPHFYALVDDLIDLGPLARDAAPDLAKLLIKAKDQRTRATLARVLRAVDTDAARAAGVR